MAETAAAPCEAKHAKPTPPIGLCPQCEKDALHHIEIVATAAVACNLLHARDRLRCSNCAYEVTGKLLARRYAQKQSLVPCEACKGAGFVLPKIAAAAAAAVVLQQAVAADGGSTKLGMWSDPGWDQVTGRASTFLECRCGSDDHVLRFSYYDDVVAGQPGQEEPGLFVTVHLRDGGFWSRVWAALKYVFGQPSKYGHWEETLLKAEDMPRLRQLCSIYEADWQRCTEARRATVQG